MRISDWSSDVCSSDLLKYDQTAMEAPRVVAKGVDNIALRIRAVAEEHDVAIVENPPVARALHASVEIDQEIPPEHYKAVAEIIGYVMRLKKGLPARRPRSGRPHQDRSEEHTSE